MKFLALASVFSLALASPIADILDARAAPNLSSQVIGNITQAGQDIVTLNNTLNKVDNNAKSIDFFTLVAIQNQSNKVGYDIGNGTAAAQKSSVFTKPQSQQISNKIIALKPSIFSLLDNFGRHEQAFKNQGVQGQVVTSLKAQRDQTQKFGNALGAKLVAPYKAGAPGNTTQIVNYFNKIINQYAS